MNIKQIKYFVSVTEQGSFSAAAREQHISVQAISKAMADLEKTMPYPLFIKTHRGVTLTPFGNGFLRKAEVVCYTFGELEGMADKDTVEASKLAVFLCAPAFSRNDKARSDIEEFVYHHSGIETKVSIGSGAEGITALENGACDVLITIGLLEKEGLDCVPLGTVPTGVCMAKSHPLASRSSVSLQDICDYPVISSMRFDHFNDSVLVLYQKDGTNFNIVEPDSADPKEIVRIFYAQHGLAFLANISQLGEMFPDSVVVPITPEDAKVVPICLITPTYKKTAAYLRVEHLLTPRR